MIVNPHFTEIYPDPNDKTILAVTYQDAEPVLENNKVLRNRLKGGEDGGRLIASVPTNIIYQWLVEEWVKGNTNLRPFTREFNETVVLPKLRDPNWKYVLV